ncbi:hypothetical protein D0869_05700 [Hortaea werneckii]|uniref:RRM domain-containing protein n=1 Tax=Hortaea werneckii TaxID=91943 RepID=A0A3M6WXD5_HORWE|nr:hypothetical protein KC334_g11359 [Hortaea werneckii]KAI6977877.1 hypothetical protein KC355_g11236 [Hortaea werneckii]KAI7166955.1 hypothetical protein KC324_g11905 [Hortaea werneckii]KAI7549105.1 hypothetical protein KC316_g14437 [Hortaea werneckii]KAI7658481.1 hypothetical protein KC318_g11202 [Hortaea werneckii]
MAAATVPPNQSLYLQNLPEKHPKPSLRRELYALFSTYGAILDITALKTPQMRGQAHILFRDIASANLAMREAQGFELGGRPIRISFSRNRSQTLAKMTGVAIVEGQQNGTQQAAGAQQQTTTTSALPPPPGQPAAPGTGGAPAQGTGLPPPPGLQPQQGQSAGQSGPSPSGTKRPREEDDEGESEGEEDEMEMSEDED